MKACSRWLSVATPPDLVIKQTCMPAGMPALRKPFRPNDARKNILCAHHYLAQYCATMSAKPYSEMVLEAEKAVSSVKDAELRRVAFEKILNDLISGGNEQGGPIKATHPVSGSKKTAKKSTAPRAKAGGPQKYVEELITDKFFAKPKTITEVRSELENRGHHIPLTSLSGPLQKLCQQKSLRRQKDATKGKKKTFLYSNW
jgi:hypothetical protein